MKKIRRIEAIHKSINAKTKSKTNFAEVLKKQLRKDK